MPLIEDHDTVPIEEIGAVGEDTAEEEVIAVQHLKLAKRGAIKKMITLIGSLHLNKMKGQDGEVIVDVVVEAMAGIVDVLDPVVSRVMSTHHKMNGGMIGNEVIMMIEEMMVTETEDAVQEDFEDAHDVLHRVQVTKARVAIDLTVGMTDHRATVAMTDHRAIDAKTDHRAIVVTTTDPQDDEMIATAETDETIATAETDEMTVTGAINEMTAIVETTAVKNENPGNHDIVDRVPIRMQNRRETNKKLLLKRSK